MGYIQDKLKEALGGNKITDSKNTAIRDWTPNNLKVLVISRNYILAVHHVGGLGGSKVVKLDLEQVKADLGSVHRNGAIQKLNTILKRRSLSCMEEFYVDSLFLENPPILDLVSYVEELVGTTSRLRYFGYGGFPLGSDEWIRGVYQRNKRNLEYALATDTSKPVNVESRDVGYSDWYKNYYLRPQYYRLDEENGKLSSHFKKFEYDYQTFLVSRDRDKNDKELLEGLKYISCVNDVGNVEYLRKFDLLIHKLTTSKDDNIKDALFKVLRGCVGNEDVFSGLTPSRASNILAESKEKVYLLKSYERFKVLDKNDKNIDREKVNDYLKKGRGFINLENILDTVCTGSIKALSTKGYKDLVGVALIMSERHIPQGKLRDTYIKKPSEGGTLNGYFMLIEELIGEIV